MPKRKFKLVGGGHSEGGRSFDHGDVVESDLPLDTMFKNKWQKVDDEVKVAKGRREEAQNPRLVESMEDEPDKKSQMDHDMKSDLPTQPNHGEDVTENFKIAEEGGFEVYVRSKKYTVVRDGEALSQVPLSKDEVKEFIVDFQDKEEEQAKEEAKEEKATKKKAAKKG